VFRNKYKDMGLDNDEASSRKKHNLIKKSINKVRQMTSIKLFRLLGALWILAASAIVSVQFTVSNSYYASIDKNLNVFIEGNNLFQNYVEINSGLLDLSFLAEYPSVSFSGIYTDNDLISQTTVLAALNDSVTKSLQNINIINSLQIAEGVENSEYFELFDSSNGQESEILKLNLENHSQSVQTCSFQMLFFASSVLNSYVLNQTNLTDEQLNDIKMFKWNYYNKHRGVIDRYTKTHYENALSDLSSIIRTQFLILILLAANLLFSIVFVIYYIWLRRKVGRKKQAILFLFLDIPREEVRDIFKKCEIFLNFCNVGCSDQELLGREGVRQQQATVGFFGRGGLFREGNEGLHAP
jgi:hypothetical protein